MQSILFTPPANNITKTHSIISWFYDPSLQFNCFIWLHKDLAEINSFKSLAFFQGFLFPRYQSSYVIMFYHQRDESNCLDHSNCIIKGDIFGSTVQGTFPIASSEKWVSKKSTTGAWTPSRRNICRRKDQYYLKWICSLFFSWPFGKPLGTCFSVDWFWGRKGHLEKVSLSSVSVPFCECRLD